MLHIKAAKYLSGFKLWIAFDDGTDGEVDLDGVLNGPVFEPLRDINTLKKVVADPEFETVVWPNGANLVPEFLKKLHKEQLQPRSIALWRRIFRRKRCRNGHRTSAEARPKCSNSESGV